MNTRTRLLLLLPSHHLDPHALAEATAVEKTYTRARPTHSTSDTSKSAAKAIIVDLTSRESPNARMTDRGVRAPRDAPGWWHASTVAACLFAAALLAVSGALMLAHVRTAPAVDFTHLAAKISALEGEVARLTTSAHGEEAQGSVSREAGLMRAMREEMEGLNTEVAGMRRKLLSSMASAVGLHTTSCPWIDFLQCSIDSLCPTCV